MCVPGCLETVGRQLSRRGLIGGAGLAAVAGAAATLALPARAAEVRSFTRVVDLTHALGPDFPTYDGGANLEMETLVTLAKDGYNMARWHLVEHTGTHMDAPIHFGEGVQSADAIHGGQITTATTGDGAGGTLSIETNDLFMTDGGVLSASTGFIDKEGRRAGTGPGGAIEVAADRIYVNNSLIGANTLGSVETAEAGSLTVTADVIEFVNEGRIFNGTNGAGDGGDVSVTARTILADATVDHVNQFHTGIASTAEAGSTGASGSVTVRADDIRLVQGGLIATSSQGDGNAGNVIVVARESLVIRGRSVARPSSISVSSQNAITRADVGNVRVRAGDIEMADGGRIEATNLGLGRSGGVTIRADRLRLAHGAEITAASLQVDAGDVVLMVGDLLDLENSGVTTSAVDGRGGGGNILIDPEFVVLDDSRIVAEAAAGRGGHIRIGADNLVRSPDSQISAASGDPALSGTVVISSPEVDLSGGLVVLESALLDAASQLRERCGARRDVGASSFTGVGRGGLPASPDAPLASGYTDADGRVGEKPAKAASGRVDEAALPSSVRLVGLAPCRSWD